MKEDFGIILEFGVVFSAPFIFFTLPMSLVVDEFTIGNFGFLMFSVWLSTTCSVLYGICRIISISRVKKISGKVFIN